VNGRSAGLNENDEGERRVGLVVESDFLRRTIVGEQKIVRSKGEDDIVCRVLNKRGNDDEAGRVALLVRSTL